MEDDTAEQFSEMTAALQIEKEFEERTQRGLKVAHVAQIAAGIYKVARSQGLPRKAAKELAVRYFDWETYPHTLDSYKEESE